MRQFVDIALFSSLALAAICILARFPESWLGRILFSRQGPLPIRGESRSHYLFRWALFAASAFAQSLLVLGIGWLAYQVDPSLAESLFFLVFWVVVVPVLAAAALLGSLLATGAGLWRRYVGAERVSGRPVHVNQA